MQIENIKNQQQILPQIPIHNINNEPNKTVENEKYMNNRIQSNNSIQKKIGIGNYVDTQA